MLPSLTVSPLAPVFHDFVVMFHNTLKQATAKTEEHLPSSYHGHISLPVVTSLLSGANNTNVTATHVAMETAYAEMVSPPSAPDSGNALPSSEHVPPATPILSNTTNCHLDRVSFNPNSLLSTSSTPYPFTCVSSSLPSAALMVAAMGRAGGMTGVRSLAPKPRSIDAEQAACPASDCSAPAKKARLESS